MVISIHFTRVRPESNGYLIESFFIPPHPFVFYVPKPGFSGQPIPSRTLSARRKQLPRDDDDSNTSLFMRPRACVNIHFRKQRNKPYQRNKAVQAQITNIPVSSMYYFFSSLNITNLSFIYKYLFRTTRRNLRLTSRLFKSYPFFYSNFTFGNPTTISMVCVLTLIILNNKSRM